MCAAEITRAQTAERARLLTVESYDVALDFTRGPRTFGSTTTIRFGCAEPGAASHADLAAETVRAITLNGRPLDPAAAWADDRVALPGLARRNELRVVAECAYTSSGTGMHRSAQGGTYVYGKLAQAYARTAYACFDQPDLKAGFTFTVTAPRDWAVLSNQPAGSSERGPGDTRIVRFLPTARLPTFTTTVVAGDFHVVTGVHTTPGGQRIPLELACRAGLADDLDPAALFALTGRGLDFYTGWFATRYPYAKYGQVFVPELSCLASEDAGCVLVSEQLLFRSGASAAADERRVGVLLHEMAHMWFGDLATERWWDDLWLSESFAEFCGCHAQAGLGLYPHAWSAFSVGGKSPGFAQDQLPSAHPVASSAATVSEAVANFDGISYAKGAAVLRQLSAAIGEDRFTAGLRGYLARHAYGNARLADLIAALSDAAGQDLAAWSRAWLETAGPNTLRCEYQADAAGLIAGFTIVQEAPARYPALRPHHVTVGLYERSAGGLVRTRQVAADVAGPRAPVPSLTGVPRPDLALLNDDDTAYVIVRFDPRSLATVLSSVAELPDPAARAVCWNAVLDLVRQAELPVAAFTAMLAGAMRSEPSESVLRALHAQAELILTRLAGPEQAAAGKRLLASAAADALAAAGPGQRTWAELLSWTATSDGQLDLVAAALAGRPAAGGPPLDAGLRWSFLRRLAAAGRAGDERIDAELARDPSDAGRRQAAACRAAVPDARHKEAAWRLLTDVRTGPETAAAVAGGLLQPEHATLLASYPARYLAELPRVWATRAPHARVHLANLLFPYPAVSPDVITALEEFLARPGDPGLARIVRDHHDTARRALRLRGLASPS